MDPVIYEMYSWPHLLEACEIKNGLVKKYFWDSEYVSFHVSYIPYRTVLLNVPLISFVDFFNEY
jgi:hypothetical protein